MAYLTDDQRRLIDRLVKYQEEDYPSYPFLFSTNSEGRGVILGISDFDFDSTDFQSLVDQKFLSKVGATYRITHKGLKVMAIKLTVNQKDTLRKLVAYKDQGGSYPFTLIRNSKGNWVNIFSPDFEFRFIDVERLIDFGLLQRNSDGYRITNQGYEAIHNDFEAQQSVSEDCAFLHRQLKQHRSNWNKLKAKEAIYAVGETPLHLLNQIEAEGDIITDLRKKISEFCEEP